MSTRRGFTVAEVALAGLTLVLIIMPLIDVMRSSSRGTAQGVHLTRALQLARSVVDTATALAYDQLDDVALSGVVGKIEVPVGLTAPRVDPIQMVSETSRLGVKYQAKIVIVHVGWVKVEGKDQGEVVLRGTVLSGR